MLISINFFRRTLLCQDLVAAQEAAVDLAVARAEEASVADSAADSAADLAEEASVEDLHITDPLCTEAGVGAGAPDSEDITAEAAASAVLWVCSSLPLFSYSSR